MVDVLTGIEVQGANKIASGKVREIFDAGDDHMIIVTTDRISAFDVVLPDPIPYKGYVLNLMSLFWFDMIDGIVPNHVVTSDVNKYPPPFNSDPRLSGRSMLVRKAEPLPVECVVRGYLAGSGWREYKEKGSICGIGLPGGMVESQKLPEPLFTPSTKESPGTHDENIDFERAIYIVGKDNAERIRDLSIKIYSMAADFALKKGIIIADTKFEFGIVDGELMIIDEVLTPDSSRFWSKDTFKPGIPQPSFDKQFVRDYLDTLNWDKKSPGPHLPADVIEKTVKKYIDAYEMITGSKFPFRG